MFLEQIILDGFKSYKNRTIIKGFDANFNAITGLNGSGKSNILDAICFVLGITNYTQLRVGSQAELIYKQGQADVRKASVTLVFNNKEKAKSPPGYEVHDEITVMRQIAVGGKNKYMINGSNAQVQAVQNLFQSVQLNIQNPHFLIMQGHITKVLNMKPPEILGLLEEAAGTRMYEDKKEKALLTIQKKQQKLDEIQKLLHEEIEPKIQTLRQEVGEYRQFKSNEMKIQDLKKKVVAFDWMRHHKTLQRSADDVAKFKEELRACTAKTQQKQQELKATQARVADLQRQMEQDREKGPNASAPSADALLDKLSKEVVKLQTDQSHKLEKLSAAEAGVKKNEQDIRQLEVDKQEAERERRAAEQALETAQARQRELEEKLQAIQRGYADAGRDGGAKTIQDQLMEADAACVRLEQEANGLKLERQQLAVQIQQLKQKLSGANSKDYEDRVSQRATLARQLEKLGGDAMDLRTLQESEAALNAKQRKLLGQQSSLQSKADNLRRSINWRALSVPLKSHEALPAEVFGPVSRLVKVLMPEESAVALEAAAGGKLTNVVVANDSVSGALIQGKKLQERTTFIPLNKIRVPDVKDAENKVKKAQRLVGDDKATHALMLVEPQIPENHSAENFDPEILRPALEYVWGETIICQSAVEAKAVTFSPEIGLRSVTLEGDVFEPRGTLTGGSTGSQFSTLKRLAELEETTLAPLRQISEELSRISQEKSVIQQRMDQAKSTSDLVHQIELLDREISFTSHGASLVAMQTKEQRLREVDARLEQISIELTSAGELKSRIETQLKRSKDSRKTEEDRQKEVKKELDKASEEVKKAEKARITAMTSLEEYANESHTLVDKMRASASTVDQLRHELTKLDSVLKEKKQQCDELDQQVQLRKRALAQANSELRGLRDRSDQLMEDVAASEAQERRIKEHLESCQTQRSISEKELERLQRTNPWINDEKQYFGSRNSEYALDDDRIRQINKEIQDLEERNRGLSKNLNKRADTTLTTLEQQYRKLIADKEKVENDRDTIEDVIRKLDEKKNATIQKTYEKVNRDFSSIFKTLLPGACAKLQPEEGMTIFDGLEVKVGFGSSESTLLWKDSLTELSGGQRSLLALSLILAMLLFKPAPMYILDEIDSALDLSHTQNIGQMLRTHFGQSQFIIVSLKEGMFNNANVLFKTRFSDGVSCVDRMEYGRSR